jgi:hypothetical protein
MIKTLPVVVDRRALSSSEAWRSMSASDRLEAVEKIKIFAPDARGYLTRLDERLRGGGPVTSGKAGALMTGPDGIGKHTLIQHLSNSNPPVPTDTMDSHRIIVVPPIAKPDPGSLTEAIELASGWKYRERLFGGAGPAFQVNKICSALKTRVLVFDRAMFLCGQHAIAAEAVPFLIGVMDAGQVLVILVASQTLEKRIKATRGLAGRFFKWRLAAFEYGPHWSTAIKQFDERLPFENGCLTRETMPERLYVACWGKIPRFVQMTMEAARTRLRRKSHDVLEMEDFRHAYAELEPDDGENPFNPEYTATILMDKIARGPQVAASDLTGVDR